jgi:hypothetical protein
MKFKVSNNPFGVIFIDIVLILTLAVQVLMKGREAFVTFHFEASVLCACVSVTSEVVTRNRLILMVKGPSRPL